MDERAQSAPTAKNVERRRQLKSNLQRKLQQEHGADAIRTQLIQGELDMAPELRQANLTPSALKSLEARVAAAMQQVSVGIGKDNRSALPAMKREPPSRRRPMTGNFSADLSDMASWTEVNKYREGFFKYELQKDMKQREDKLEKMRQELAHQRGELQNKRAAKQAELQRAAEEEAERYAKYLDDKSAEEARVQAKTDLEIRTRQSQNEERRARRAVEQRLRELDDGETLRKISEQQEADRRAFEKKVKDDERNNRMFIEELENHRQLRAQQKQDAENEQLRLNAEWKAILDKQEADRAEQYRLFKERIQRAQRVYESSAGAEDAAREAREEAARKRWQEQFERETKAKEDARHAHRVKMEKECMDGCQEQMEIHRKEKQEAREAALRLKERMKQQAVEEKEERHREKVEENQRAAKYRSVLAGQIDEIRNGRANDPGSHVMTPLEASLNRPLLVSMKERKYEGFCATLG